MQHVRHLITGVAITTGQKSYLVNEACSGVYSLFSCLCVVTFFSIVQKRDTVHTLLNIVQTACWVIVANALRVFLIVYTFTSWGISLDSGWKHDLVGVFTFLTALGMSLSTDMLLQLAIPSAGDEEDTAHAYEADTVTSSSEGLILNFRSFLNKPRLAAGTSMWVVIGVFAGLFAPLSTVHAAWLFTTGGNSILVEHMSDEITENFELPQQLDNWTLVDVERINRTPDDPLGLNSIIFTYTGSGLNIQFSLDGYYSKWHDLAHCYTALGWQLQDQNNIQDATSGNHATVLSLQTEDGRRALSIFSCFDSRRQTVEPGSRTFGLTETFPAMTERILRDRLPWNNSGGENTSPIAPPLFQLQLICSSQHELLDSELTNLESLFHRLCQHGLQSLAETAE